LVIHAPKSKVQSENKRSFERTLETGIGDGYAVTRNELALLTPGLNVVLLDKDTRRRAEGELVKLEPNGWTRSGIQRYDVYTSNLKVVPYRPERLNRRGIAIR
jgi:hypothetical protein